MKYFLYLILCLITINCFSQNRMACIDNIKFSLDSLYEERSDLLSEILNERCDRDTMIMIPTFYASQKYIDVAKNIDYKCIVDFEKSTGLKRTDIFQYINYRGPILTDAMIYRDGHLLGLFYQSEIKDEWRTFMKSEDVVEKWRYIAGRLFEMFPEYVFCINNISGSIFFIKNESIYCYFTKLDVIEPLSEELLNNIDITEFSFFLGTAFFPHEYWL